MSLRITILGAGAMGCLIGGLLQKGGAQLHYIARGAQLEAMRAHGLTLTCDAERWHAPVQVSDDAANIGPQDAVILATKAHQLPAILPMLPSLMDANTIIVPAVNGLPWWYFQRHGGPLEGRVLQAVDPGGHLASAVAPGRIIGCVNYLAGHISAPGVIHYVPALKRRIVLGEVDGMKSGRLQALGDVFGAAGFEPVLTETIRQSVWHKLWGNIAFNPIGALTHATIDQLAEGYPDVDLVSAVMNEARMVADKLGIHFDQTTQSRIAAAAHMRGHRTSMQLDMEAGRPTEIEAIVGAVREIAKWVEVDTPHLNSMYSLVRVKEYFAMRRPA